MKTRALRPSAALAFALLAAPAAAQAHALSTGMGPLVDAVAHFAVTPQDVLPVLALGLFAGLRGPACARALLAALPLAWLAGGAAALAGAAPSPLMLEGATAALFMAAGALLAANAPGSASVGLVLAGALGIVRGLADLAAGAGASPTLGALLATGAGAGTGFALAASLTLPLRRAWMVTAVRVAGSWLAASGLLLAGWLLRFGAQAAS